MDKDRTADIADKLNSPMRTSEELTQKRQELYAELQRLDGPEPEESPEVENQIRAIRVKIVALNWALGISSEL